MLMCSGLRKAYGAKAAVDGVDLKVESGSIFGLLGPNGAGKSTLLKMVTGLIWPDEGQALIRGYDVHSDHKAALQRVGAIVEWPAFYPYLSARDNIRTITGQRSKAFNEKLEYAADLVGMSQWLDKKVQTFSTGMKQRIGIALACLPDSEFIILDEPANGLDPNGMIELRQIIRALRNEHGATILVSSHLLGEIEQICDKVAIMHNGKIATSGDLAQLIGDSGKIEVGINDIEKAQQVLSLLNLEILPPAANAQPYCYINAMPEMTAEVNSALCAAGCGVWHLAYHKRSLENLFTEITVGTQDVE